MIYRNTTSALAYAGPKLAPVSINSRRHEPPKVNSCEHLYKKLIPFVAPKPGSPVGLFPEGLVEPSLYQETTAKSKELDHIVLLQAFMLPGS